MTCGPWIQHKKVIMFEFLRKKPSNKKHQAEGESYLSTHMGERSPNGLHREVIRGALSELVRTHAIAHDTLVFDAFPLRRRTGEKEMHVQLIMLKWNESLLYKAPMLQHQLQLELGRYASAKGVSAFIVTWKFAPACITFALPQKDHLAKAKIEATKVEKEMPLFQERQFAPQASAATTLAPSLSVSHEESVAFLPTEVDPVC